MIELKSNLKPKTQIELTPLVDVIFTILLFFILSYTEFGLYGQKVILSQEKKVIERREGGPIIISAFKNGDILINDKKVSIKQIPGLISQLVESNKNYTEVVIDGDGDLDYQKVILIMDAVKESGISNIYLHTRR